MNRALLNSLCLAVLLSILSPSIASTDIAIDALHGLPELLDYNVDLETLYPDYNFISFERDRVPLSTPIYYGMLRGDFEPTNFDIELTEEADALYLVMDIDNYVPGQIDQLPFINIIAPDESYHNGLFGMWHLDNAMAGTYDVTLSGSVDPVAYRVGTGPSFWDVYPPEDYDAMLFLNGYTWQFFRGFPLSHSASDIDRIQSYLDAGGGYGLIGDSEEPVAMKPIIRASGFECPAELTLEVPGHLTYRKPQVVSETPVQWTLNTARSEQEILYEAAFLQPLNFISCDPSGSVTNRSWATTHDVKLIEFIPYQGYRLTEFGTLQPGETASKGSSALYPAKEIKTELNRILMKEADYSGLTNDESVSFFGHKYNWISRILAEVSDHDGPVCLYRVEGNDYEGLMPLSVAPQPQEIVRVLWVYSMLSTESSAIAPVHPRDDVSALSPGSNSSGVVHEYGFFRDRPGGSLDEIDEWDWHCYGVVLADSTNHVEWSEQILFHTTGSSPLVSTFMDQVENVQGDFSSAIVSQAGDAEVILKGDDDTYSWWGEIPFPAGSYPPVVLARETDEGGRLTGYADLHFFADCADNLQFNQNMFSWLAGEPQDPVPDIDIADAVLEAEIIEDEPITTSFMIANRGDADLTLTVTPPAAGWITIDNSGTTTLAAGEVITYQLTWSSVGMSVGFHTTTIRISSNDPNEAELEWPVTMRVRRMSDVPPSPAHANSFELVNAFPNPFNSQVSIQFSLDYSMKVDFTLLNILGQETETLSERLWPLGTSTLSLDFSNRPSGLYFLKATAGNSHQLIKLMHLK